MFDIPISDGNLMIHGVDLIAFCGAHHMNELYHSPRGAFEHDKIKVATYVPNTDVKTLHHPQECMFCG